MVEINPRKQRIVDAALEVLKESSVEETTVRKIAAKAGLTTGALYYHYKNKDEIIFDVISYAFHFTDKLTDEADRNEEMKSKEVLLNEIVNRVRRRLKNKQQQKLNLILLTDIIAKKENDTYKYRLDYNGMTERTANLFSRAFDIQNNEKEKMVANILIAAIDGIAIQQSLGNLQENEDEMIETFIDFFVTCIPKYLNGQF